MNLVIGSGPSASACAHALLARGETVLLVDGGIDLEAPQKAELQQLSGGYVPGAFDALLRLQPKKKIGSGLPVKLVHGSDFPYRETDRHLGLEMSGAGASASLAVGGLSNVWGAALLPYVQHDIANWPVTTGDLAPHYAAAVRIAGLSGRVDDLAEAFPLFTDHPYELRSSSQAQLILDKLGKIRPELARAGITYGASRLAIRPSKETNIGCVYCGRCLYGCPYGCIYSSADDVPELVSQKLGPVQYRTNTIIESVHESGAGVTVRGFDRVTGEPMSLEAERAFVGAGVIPSTRILLNSLEAYDRPVEVLDSQYFLFPMLLAQGNPDVQREALQTLSQLFIEIRDDAISRHTVHLQLYTYNDIISGTLKHRLRFLPVISDLVVKNLEHRLVIIQGFLHSDDSGRMHIELKRDAGTKKNRLLVTGAPRASARNVIRRLIGKLSKSVLGLVMFPLGPAVEILEPGRGFHYGGSFPMSAAPAGMQSDIHGRLPGFSRTHVVDASVFPSIAATTITLTAMANAHRIGSTKTYG